MPKQLDDFELYLAEAEKELGEMATIGEIKRWYRIEEKARALKKKALDMMEGQKDEED